MRKVNRLGWTTGISFQAYSDHAIGIRTNDAAALPQIRELLPPDARETDDPVVDTLFSLRVGPPSKHKGRKNYHIAYGGAARLARTLDLAEALQLLENQIHLTVAFQANEADCLFVHAGVVGWQGKAILVPGRSHTGKTTLVSELLRAGATYYSDDMAVIDRRGLVHPYPVALSVRGEDGTAKCAPESIGGQIGEQPLPVGLVVVTKHVEGATWRPQTLSPSHALLALLDHAVAARRAASDAMQILEKVATTARTLKGDRGDAADVVPLLLDAVAKRRAAA